MAECFCGCGRRVGRATRKLNRTGVVLEQMLAGIHGLVLPRLDPGAGLSGDERRGVEQSRASMERFADEGAVFRAGLVRVLHDEASVRGLDNQGMLAWIRTAGELNERAIEQD